MNIWHDIDEERIYPTDFMAVVEISMGSNMKYELDKKTGMLSLDRVLFTAPHNPMNYGIKPDIVSMAKGLGGGMPIGAICATAEVAKAFTP